MSNAGILDARWDAKAGRVVLSGEGTNSDAFAALVGSLSWPSHHPDDDSWHVDLTPATAKRLHDFGFRLDEGDPEGPLQKLVNQWHHADSQLVRRDQPAIRVFDQWEHQLQGFHFAAPRPAAGIFFAMGAGKTKTTLDIVINRNTRRILILCPLSVCGVWRGEIEKHVPKSIPRRVLVLDEKVGSVMKKATYLNSALQMSGAVLFVVCNYDSAKVNPLANIMAGTNWDLCALDESHRIKDGRTVIGRFCAKLGKRCKQRECLTGTPMPNGPLDLHGQFTFLDPGLFGSSFTSFKNRYSIPHAHIRGKTAGYVNQEELIARLSMMAIRIEADVLDLPEPVHQRIGVTLTPDVRAKYEQFKRDAIVDIEQGIVTAANAPVKLLRLQQVTSGHWKTEDDKIVPTDHNPKLKYLEDIVSDLDHSEPLVVFCRFKFDLIALEGLAAKLKLKYAEVSGRKKELNPDGTLPEGVNIMGVQIQSGGLGVNLTRSAVCVFYSLGYSLADYQQALARLVRPDQKRNVRFIHLVAENTVDEQVYEALETKANVVEMVMSALRKEQDERQSVQHGRDVQAV